MLFYHKDTFNFMTHQDQQKSNYDMDATFYPRKSVDFFKFQTQNKIVFEWYDNLTIERNKSFFPLL